MYILLLGLALAFSAHQIAVDPNTTSLPTSMMGVDVTGSTMGIVGMGDIGYKVAQRGRGFDMKILYHNRRRRQGICHLFLLTLGVNDYVFKNIMKVYITLYCVQLNSLDFLMPILSLAAVN